MAVERERIFSNDHDLWEADTERDARLEQEVLDALGAEPRLDPTDIRVSVSLGRATLTGSVRAAAERRRARACAARVAGVVDVRDELTVRSRGGTPNSMWHWLGRSRRT